MQRGQELGSCHRVSKQSSSIHVEAQPVFAVQRQLNYSVKTDRLVLRTMDGEVTTGDSVTLAAETDYLARDFDLACPICSNLLLDPQDCI